MTNSRLLLDNAGQIRPVISHGKGIFLWDTNGKRYLDAVGGVHVVTIGHGVAEIVEAGYRQASNVAFASTRHFVSEAAVELSERIVSQLPESLDWVYFVSSGSEAAEMALQVCYRYFSARGEPRRTRVVGRWNSYHGGTVATASMGGHRAHRARFDPYLLPFPHIQTPHCARCPFELKYPDCQLRCADDLAEVIDREEAGSIAAFIAEPIVGTTGGAITPPPGYYERIRQICDEYGILFIADEVVTGFGRTGMNFGLDHWDAIPDIVICSKGMSSGYAPLGAVIVRDHVVADIRKADISLNLRLTYSANPLSCAIGLAVQDYVAEHGLIAQSEAMGSYLKITLEAVREQIPSIVEIRGRGLLLGVELAVADGSARPFPRMMRIAEKVVQEAQGRGLILLSGTGTPRSADGDHLLISPPFIISRTECEMLADMLASSIKAALERD